MLRFAVLAALAVAIVAHHDMTKMGKHEQYEHSHEEHGHRDGPCEFTKYMGEFVKCISLCEQKDFTLHKCHHHKHGDHNSGEHQHKHPKMDVQAGGKPDQARPERQEKAQTDSNQTESSCKPCVKENFEDNTPADQCFIKCSAEATGAVKNNVFDVEEFITAIVGMFKPGNENTTEALAIKLRTVCYPPAQQLDGCYKQFTAVNYCIYEDFMKGCKRCGGHHGHKHHGKKHHGKHGKGQNSTGDAEATNNNAAENNHQNEAAVQA